MLWGKLLALLLGLFFLVLLVRSIGAALHYKRSFDDSSPRAAEGLQRHLKGGGSPRVV